MAKWAGEGEDWVQEMTMHPPQKDEVIVALLMKTRQRDGKGIQVEIRSEAKILDAELPRCSGLTEIMEK